MPTKIDRVLGIIKTTIGLSEAEIAQRAGILLKKASVSSELKMLLAIRKIQRMGGGTLGSPYRYMITNENDGMIG